MPYATIFERRAMLRLIESVLRTKFGVEGVALLPAIAELDDAEKYVVLNVRIAMAQRLEEVRQAVARAGIPAPWSRRVENGKCGFLNASAGEIAESPMALSPPPA